MRKQRVSILAGLMLCLGAGSAAIPNNVTLRDFFGLTFNRPLFFAEVPGKDSTFVVAEQYSGSVIVVRRVNNAWTKSTLVTLTGLPTNQLQMGLLGFAFHPNFKTNRKYYLSYNPTTTSSVIAERVADTSSILDAGASSARTLLTLAQPGTVQNGGTIAFGPEGYLYIGFGDGIGNGDPQGHAQNHNDLLGKMLRVDVNSTSGALAYAIPSDNPFVGQSGYREEIWALGLRQPWKWSFNQSNGELWAADVGQGNPNSAGYEEVDRITKGANMGWPVQEAAHCYPPPSTGSCNTAGLTAPALELDRNLATVITGGVFFNGSSAGAFNGAYFFGDYGSGRLWAGRTANGVMTEYSQIGTLANVASFGLDSRGRVFAVKLGNSNGQNITANSGTVMILESPDIVPVGIQAGPRRVLRPLSMKELFNSGKYSLKSLDGKTVSRRSNGVFMAYEKDAPNSLRLIPVIE